MQKRIQIFKMEMQSLEKVASIEKEKKSVEEVMW